jgi:hypothetical protein
MVPHGTEARHGRYLSSLERSGSGHQEGEGGGAGVSKGEAVTPPPIQRRLLESMVTGAPPQVAQGRA